LEGGGGARSGGSLFVQGLASNVANPKIAVFFMAFMPQFVPTGTTHPGWMLLTLGAGFAGLTFLVKGTVGLAAGTFSIWLRARPRWIVAMHRISGVVLIALGLRLAAQSRT
jgi:threonine/homoserine/homoserine lactone efflux protein